MFNESTLKFYLRNTLSNKYIHCLFVIIEYFCFVFPSIFQAPLKLKHYGESTKAFTASTPQVAYLFLIRYIQNNKSMIISIIIFGLVLLILFSYYCILIFGIPKKRIFFIPMIILVHLIDLIVFRYLSLIPINYFIWLFTGFFKMGTAVSNSISLIFLILIIFFIFTSHYYIEYNSVIINITNPLLVDKEQSYPYDHLSSSYENILLIIKALISFEYNYFEYSDKINSIVITFNVMLLTASILLLFLFSLKNIFIKFNYSLFYVNIEQNYLRNMITIFNFFICLLSLLVFNENVWIIVLAAVNFTILSIYLEHRFLFRYKLNNLEISYELLLLMIIPNVDKKSFLFQYSEMLDSCYVKHIDSCQTPDCSICYNYSKDFHNNLVLFYKYLRNEAKSTDSLYENIVKLLYYKMTKQPIKLLRFYIDLLHRHRKNKQITRAFKIIVENWIIKDDPENEVLINSILDVKRLECNLRLFLNNFTMFSNEHCTVKKPETVIQLSYDISNIINECRVLSSKNVHLDDQFQLIENNKNITGALNYTMNILRFIIQAIINQEIVNMPNVNIDNLEEYFNLHFNSDEILICSFDLMKSHRKHVFRVIKVTGELSKSSCEIKYLNNFFPKGLAQQGLDLFYKLIRSKKGNEKTFIFPFQFKGIIAYIRYTFHIIPTLEKQFIMFFGYYSKEKTKCMLLHNNPPHGIHVIGFCKQILKLLRFKSKWVQYLKSNNYVFKLNNIFKKINEISKDSILECVLDYDHFLKKSTSVFAQLRSLESFKSNQKNENNLEYLIKTLESYNGYSLIILLEKLVDFGNGYRLYSIKVKNKNTTSIFSQDKKGKGNYEPKDTVIGNLITNTIQSSTYSGDSSFYSNYNTIGNYTTQYQLLNPGLKLKISKKIKLLSFFSIIMIGFNIILIFLCVIFLYTQITNSNNMVILNELFFKFKSVQICFSNVIVILSASACFAENPQNITCTNSYLKYSDYFMETYNLGNDYCILKYISLELKIQATYALTILNDFKSHLYSSKNTKFISFLDNEMKYYQIEDQNDIHESVIVVIKDSFEQNMRNYINILFQLTTTDANYEYVPLYFLSFSDNLFHFINVPEVLSTIQKEMYLGLLNYFNFYYSFSDGEEEIKNEFIDQSNINYQMNTSFMLLIGCLNLLLCSFCLLNIRFAYGLYKILIINVIQQLDHNDCIAKLNKKLTILTSLVKLYDKNPNDLIKKIKTPHHPRPSIQEKQLLLKKDNSEQTPASSKISLGSSFSSGLLKNLINLLLILFSIFYFVIIIFDIVISDYYSKLFKVFEYISLQFDFENGVFSNLAITSLIHIGNLTSEDLAFLIGKKDTEDGIINTLIQGNLNDINDLSVFNKINSTTFPLMSNNYSGSCDTIFTKFNDPILSRVFVQLGKDYTKISETVCVAFDSLMQENFFYLRSDTIDRTHKLANKKSSRDYQSLLSFVQDFELYETYTIVIFLYRPLFFNFRWDILVPLISYNFTTYVILVGIYLAVNIIMEIIIFAVVKWVIIKKLDNIQENLFLLNNCLKYH